MSIQNEIDRINQNISDTYNALKTKGVTMPSNLNSDNLAQTINSIPQSGGNLTPLIGSTTVGEDDFITPLQVKEAIEMGRTVWINHVDNMFGKFGVNSFIYRPASNNVFSSIVINVGSDWYSIVLYGDINLNSWYIKFKTI